MIEIAVNGIVLPLPVDFSLNREVESKIFTKDENAYDISYPIDIPLTDQARMALGFPDVLANANIIKEHTGTLTIDSIFSYGVKIVVLSVSLRNKTCRISILGQYASMAEVFGSKQVNHLEMGGLEIIERIESGFGEVDYTFANIKDGLYDYGQLRLKFMGGPVNAFMRAVMNGTITRNYLFPKAVDISPDLPGNDGGISVINAYDHDRNRFVDADLYNALNSTWKYMPDLTPSNPFECAERHFWVPMFKLSKVIEACFTECGLNVSGSVLTDTQFQKIVLYNTHAINVGVGGGYVSGVTPEYYQLGAGSSRGYIFPSNHLPKMTIMEFLTQLAKRYNLQYHYDIHNKSVFINADKAIVSTPSNILDLTNYVNPEATINFERSDAFAKGYKFSFEDDPDDSAISDDVADNFDGLTFRGSFNQETDLYAISSIAVNDYAFVRSTSTYYKYLDSGEWSLHSYGICPFKNSDAEGLQEISTKIVSPPMKMIPVTMIEIGTYYVLGDQYENNSESVPFSNIGMSFERYDYIDWDNSNDTLYAPGVGHPWNPHIFQANLPSKNHLPHVVTSVGFRNGAYVSRGYYMATSGCYDSNGNYIGNYCGGWSNPEGHGLYQEWWEAFVKYVLDSYAVEYEVLMDAILYSKLQVNGTMIVIDQLRYFCKKANLVMPFPSISTLSLIKV